MTRNIFPFLVSLFAFTLSFGQTEQDQLTIKSIDDLVAKRFDRISPGCAVLVSKNGQIFYQKAYGIADIELNVQMQPNMIFRIGSITKQFTAVAILQLIEQGKISLTDSLQHYIKGFYSKGHQITIENLLTQTSGITDYLNLETNLSNPFRIDFSTKQVIDSLKNLPLDFLPNTKFAYSNSNYFLLGYIIETVTGKSYQDYLKQNIFLPLGMANTYYDNPTEIIPNRVKGYEKTNDKYFNADFISMTGFYSAGAIMTNTQDLYKWNEALKSYKLLKKETLEKAFTPFKLSDGKMSEYGYGWFLRNIEGSQTIEHGGSIFGFRAEEIYLPKDDIYIAGLFNCRQLNNDEQELCYDIAKIMLGKSPTKDIPLSDEILKRYVGVYKSDQYNVTLTIHKGPEGKLYGDLSNGTGVNMVLLAQSETLFVLPQIKRIYTTFEFVVENGKAIKIIFSQENTGEFKRIE